jgi:hypothetical protein
VRLSTLIHTVAQSKLDGFLDDPDGGLRLPWRNHAAAEFIDMEARAVDSNEEVSADEDDQLMCGASIILSLHTVF